MSFTLNVTFRGLHAIVPSHPILAHEKGTHDVQTIPRLRVLVPDARQAGSVTICECDPEHEGYSERSLAVCAHDPTVIVEQADGSHRRMPLAGHWIQLEGVAGGNGVAVHPSVGGMAHLAAALPDAVSTDPGLLISGQRPPDHRLIGGVLFESGSAFAAGAASAFSDFASPTGYQGRFSAELRVELTAPGEKARLLLVPFDGGLPIAAELTPGNGHSAIDVIVSNLCANAETEQWGPDADFARYYGLLDGYAGRCYVPHLMPPPSAERSAMASMAGRPCVGGFLPPAG